jgi:hypothetical protein
MKRWAAGLIVTAALLGSGGSASATVVTSAAKKACGPKGSADACREYLYKQCVAAAKSHGASSKEAAASCGG